ncbi:hypothetical protein BW13_05595 [Bifidobacterium sp. UTCIF-37]|nr:MULTISPECIES: hypothetical protein [unclassified Bifidobacterium]TPF86277.1 hypothetical protein BW13_05595 [Bifidobacterium sp. UTCIF-37]TPF88737.1 hypothetical protein BW11_06395 [Bifidobacterium sp. UTCIF-38]
MTHDLKDAPKDIPKEDGWLLRVTLLLAGQALSLLGSSIVQYAIWWWIVMQTHTGSAMLLGGALMSAFGSKLLRKARAHASDASALLTSLRTIAGALGSAVFVAVMVACGNDPTGVSVAFWAMIALTAVGFVMTVLFCRRR